MKSSSSTEFTTRDGRRFAFPVGLAFAVLASVAYWRGRQIPAGALGVVAALLILSGLAVPGRLGPLHRVWMRMARVISMVTTPVFMGIVYFLVITPAGLVAKLFGARLVGPAQSAGTFWRSRDEGQTSDLRRQF